MTMQSSSHDPRALLVVPTFNGAYSLERLLDSLPAEFPLFVIDSSSSDGTQKLLVDREVDHEIIPQHEFNHGGTRQKAVVDRPGYEFYIYLTQDAYLVDSSAVSKLLSYFDDQEVGAVCGRQLPHLDANPLAEHARRFNYPVDSEIKSHEDAARLGIKVAFMSNSFAGYRAEALADVGSFPNDVIVAEDMFVAARMLQSGWKVAYAGDACCYHSHNYSLAEEFRRYFDTGVFHSCQPWIQRELGGASGEGRRFVISELHYLLEKHPGWLPVAMFSTMMKFAGYHLGKRYNHLPATVQRYCSMHKGFWRR
ncbi:glycosyltransferase family 2 protein [Salinicola endophyticus]|uniref:Glycosyltransferase family 2 protein n=1 Tax=Salinicola endophyticus TaxID=1949083 RepID=A0AB74UDC5_9GAMM